jgi:hypothetical protein
MVRTNRSVSGPTAAPASMDDINLDDMFADDGDALFDEFDMDFDMDDITGGVSVLDSKRSVVSRPPPPILPPSSRTEPLEDESSTSRSRRKTKRKSKTPSFFEDDDDDYDDPPPSKKKRKGGGNAQAASTNSTTTSKKKTTTKTSQGETLSSTVMKPPPPFPKNKNKSAKSLSTEMPPPLARGGSSLTSSHSVAAAGQFGRQKRPGAFPSLPKGSSTSASNHSGRLINKLPLARSVSESSLKGKASASSTQPPQQSQRVALQPQSSYCGLSPSSTHFYPFMPSLPTEPALKSRKVYGTIDRIHTSLVGYLHTPPTTTTGILPVKENEPLFQLLQEAFKEEKSGSLAANSVRSESIGIALGDLRRTISTLDKNRLVGDLYATCALLQRQHDFLKQNCENMERWCRDSFSAEDFSFVFVPSTKQRKATEAASVFSILKTFTKRELKVKVLCTGVKDPKMAGFCQALLPPYFLPHEVIPPPDDKETKAPISTKKKSHPLLDSTNPQDKVSDFLVHNAKIKPPQPLSYANMKPARRRRNVAEMIARTARELEKAYTSRIESRKRTIERKEDDLQKLASQDNLCGIHTAGMWKWLELSGYFNDTTESEIQERLDDFRPQVKYHDVWTTSKLANRRQNMSIAGDGVYKDEENESVFDRLQSLLVDVDSGDNDDNDMDGKSIEDADLYEIFHATETADLSLLTLDERSFIQLRKIGLVDNLTSSALVGDTATGTSDVLTVLADEVQKPLKQDFPIVENGWNHCSTSPEHEDCNEDLDDAITAMKVELAQVEKMNDQRVSFLDTVSRLSCLSNQDKQLRGEREISLIAKCQLMMRKSKEMKVKSSAMNRKDDNLALPW